MKRGNTTLDAWLKTATPVKKQCVQEGKNVYESPQILKEVNRKLKSEFDQVKHQKKRQKTERKATKTDRAVSPPPASSPSGPFSLLPDDSPFPPELLADLCLLADFNWTFSDLLKTPAFSLSQLYSDLIYPQGSTRLHSFTVALIREAARSISLRKDEDLISPEMPHFELFRCLATQIDFHTVSEQLPFLLLSEILQSPMYSEDSQNEDKKWSFSLIDFPTFYSDWSVYAKLAVYKSLVEVVLDSPMIHDLLEDRIDERAKLVQARTDHQAKLTAFNKLHRGKHLKKDSEEWKKRQNMKQEVAIFRENAEAIPLRTEAVGKDHWENAYFQFEFDRNLVVISDFEQTQWRCFSSLSTKASLQKCLNPKFPQEEKLLNSLNFTETHSESSPATDFEPAVDPDDSMRESSIDQLIKLEAKVTAFYSATGKWWAEEKAIREWKSAVSVAFSPERLKELLMEFVESAYMPFKRTAPPESIVKRVNLKLWAEFPEATEAKERLWSRAVSWEHLFAMISCELAVFERYFHLKRKSFLSATSKALKKLGNGVKTRRLTRMSEKLKVQELLAEETHDDVCVECGLGGDLLCCEGCPQVAHMKCVGLQVTSIQSVPEQEWFCRDCEGTQRRVFS